MNQVSKITNVWLQRQPQDSARRVSITIDGDIIHDILEEAPSAARSARDSRPLDSGTPLQIRGGILDGSAAFVMPGLINLHTHLFRKVRADEPAGWVYSPVAATVRALRNAQDFLNAGVTTVRDLGAPDDLDVMLAELVATGQVTAPNIFAAGRPLTQTGGHNRSFSVVADGSDALLGKTRERIFAGVDWVKVMASQGGTRHHVGVQGDLPPVELEEAERFAEAIMERARPGHVYPTAELVGYTAAEMRVVADEAHRQGVFTAAHAATSESVLNCVQAGVDTVEHGTFLTREAAESVARSDSYYVPTVSTSFNRILYGRRDGWPDFVVAWATSVAEPWFASICLAHEYGLKVATGTDAGGSMAMEMQMLSRAGFSNHQVLQAATEVAADVLRQPGLGKIVPGARADIVLVAENPLEDLATLEQPLLTIKGGRIFSTSQDRLAHRACRV